MEERREEIERSIENLRYDREVLRELYHKLDGIVSDKTLSDIIFDIHLMENRIERLREQLPPQDEVEKLLNEANKILNSDEKHLYLTELNEAERKLARARRIINQRVVDKAHEEALCEAADNTLQKYADRAAKGNILKEMFEVKQQSDKKFLITPKKAGRAIIVHAHDTKGTSMVIKEASKKTSTPTRRVGSLMQESPAKKQRKSLVRAIINLLDTKYK